MLKHTNQLMRWLAAKSVNTYCVIVGNKNIKEAKKLRIANIWLQEASLLVGPGKRRAKMKLIEIAINKPSFWSSFFETANDLCDVARWICDSRSVVSTKSPTILESRNRSIKRREIDRLCKLSKKR